MGHGGLFVEGMICGMESNGLDWTGMGGKPGPSAWHCMGLGSCPNRTEADREWENFRVSERVLHVEWCYDDNNA